MGHINQCWEQNTSKCVYKSKTKQQKAETKGLKTGAKHFALEPRLSNEEKTIIDRMRVAHFPPALELRLMTRDFQFNLYTHLVFP